MLTSRGVPFYVVTTIIYYELPIRIEKFSVKLDKAL